MQVQAAAPGAQSVLQGGYEELEAKNTELKGELEGVKARNGCLEGDLQGMQAANTELKGELEGVKAKNTELEGELEVMKVEHVRLEMEKKGAHDKYSKQMAEFNVNVRAHQTLKKSVDDLKAVNAELKSANAVCIV